MYGSSPEAHGEGYREGVVVVPYSLALPYVLALYRLTLRFGAAIDGDRLSGRLSTLDESLRRLDEEVEGRLSRGLVQVENAREALRHRLAEARRTLERLQPPAEAVPIESPRDADADTPMAVEITAGGSPGPGRSPGPPPRLTTG